MTHTYDELHGMTVGQLREVAAGIDHEATIHMPGNTLSVRGTRAAVYNQQPFVPQTTMISGTGRHSSDRGISARP